MNTIIKYGLATLLGLGSVNIALAGTINISDANAGLLLNGRDVGLVDTYIAQSSWRGASNPTQEQDWVNSILGTTTSVTFTVKTDSTSYFSTTEINVFAFDARPSSDYFLVKNATWHALYENVDGLDFGVFNITDFDSGFNLGNGSLTISHVSRFNSTTPNPAPATGVPEPMSLILMSAGLLGFFSVSSRKAKAA